MIVRGLGMPVRVVKRLLGSRHGEDDERINLALIARIHPLIGIEGTIRTVAALDRASDATGNIGYVEGLDARCTVFACNNPLPGRLDAAAKRRHQAKTRYDHTSHAILTAMPLTDPTASADRPKSAEGPEPSGGGILLEKLDGVANGNDRLGGVVGDLHVELFLEGHHEFDRIKAVGAEVVDEMGAFDHFLRVHAQVLDDNLLHALGDITHRFVLVPLAKGL
ncbi:hypothetical protein CHELA20_51205 [Hyphomicrobiales bacterium]|nr:hypothetical protein CHELA41_23806 [Hyphomicrobiales bacterium]CAH1674424.1 hypothetical protein CHELA20_51205 [Hyphomicrobiales bacterium]